jgi:hypothetical protein
MHCGYKYTIDVLSPGPRRVMGTSVRVPPPQKKKPKVTYHVLIDLMKP